MKSYECKICDFNSNNLSNFKLHCNTKKHKDVDVKKMTQT